MSDLEVVLSWLGMSRYLDRLQDAGFDTWDIVMEITEKDLEILNIELGDRRKLQKEIAKCKGLTQTPSSKPKPQSLDPSKTNRQELPTKDQPKKRGYQHHPKPDPNAPDRPYSAYVMFSNHTREQLKGLNLSFTELSRRVGERWQSMSAKDKDYWKQLSAMPWENFKANLANYQKTPEYRQYQRYLAEFKEAQATKKGRSKLEDLQQSPASSKRNLLFGPTVPSASSPARGRREIPRESPVDGISEPAQKIPIKRLKTSGDRHSGTQGTRPSRTKIACEPCRQKKVKCSGERPTCPNCREAGIPCYFDRNRGNRKAGQDPNLLSKLQMYEELLSQLAPQLGDDEQQAVQRALLSPLQIDNSRDQPTQDDSSDIGGGESDASGIGSMGSTDRVDHDKFMQETNDSNNAFAGPVSESSWIQRLRKELGRPAKQGGKTRAQDASAPPYPEDMDVSLVGNHIDPFSLPIKHTADALVDSYFATVQLSFPLLRRADFVHQYEDLFANGDLMRYTDRTFIAIVQLVFAIGAVHSHFMEAEWVGDARDHMLYFARARILAVDSGILNDSCWLGQVQVFGLGSLYLLVTDQINRAWNLNGLAVRSAQSLGLHLRNVTLSMSSEERQLHAHVWFGITTLECMLTFITGRPSMVREKDCSVSVVPAPVHEPDSLPVQDGQTSAKTLSTRSSSSSTSDPSSSTRTKYADHSTKPMAVAFFRHYVELCVLAKEVIGEMYHPSIREAKWSEIQRKIEGYGQRLVKWRAGLSPPFNIDMVSEDLVTESYRVSLSIFYYSVHILINRPCLCRIDERIADQSDSSKRTNRVFANKCVNAAQRALSLVLDRPDSTILGQGPTWWMLIHHLKRALTVLFLELAFRAEHMPPEAGDIFNQAKEAVEWLRWHSASSLTTRRTWITMSRLLRLVAKRIGVTTDDIVTAPETDSSNSSLGAPQFPQSDGGPAYVDGVDGTDGVDPTSNFAPSADFYSATDSERLHYGDLAAWNQLDQFGFLRDGADLGNLFPTASEIDRMGMDGEQGGPDGDVPMGFSEGQAFGFWEPRGG